MTCESTLHSDYLEIILRGEPTSADMIKMSERNNSLLSQLRASRKPVLVLTDLTAVKKVPPETFRTATELMEKDEPYDKTAVVVNQTPLFEDLVNTIISMFADSQKMQIFHTRAEAMKWLGLGEDA